MATSPLSTSSWNLLVETTRFLQVELVKFSVCESVSYWLTVKEPNVYCENEEVFLSGMKLQPCSSRKATETQMQIGWNGPSIGV